MTIERRNETIGAGRFVGPTSRRMRHLFGTMDTWLDTDTQDLYVYSPIYRMGGQLNGENSKTTIVSMGKASAPPVGAVIGSSVVVGSSPTDAFAGQENKLAILGNNGWLFYSVAANSIVSDMRTGAIATVGGGGAVSDFAAPAATTAAAISHTASPSGPAAATADVQGAIDALSVAFGSSGATAGGTTYTPPGSGLLAGLTDVQAALDAVSAASPHTAAGTAYTPPGSGLLAGLTDVQAALDAITADTISSSEVIYATPGSGPTSTSATVYQALDALNTWALNPITATVVTTTAPGTGPAAGQTNVQAFISALNSHQYTAVSIAYADPGVGPAAGTTNVQSAINAINIAGPGGGGSGDFKADGTIPMTGRLLAADGATNGIRIGTRLDFFVDGTDPKIQSVASNPLYIHAATDGYLLGDGYSQMARWNSTGLLVGTTGTPSSIFHVLTTGNANSIRVSQSTGNVGIGQAAGSQMLAVTGTANVTGQLTLGLGSGNGLLVGGKLFAWSSGGYSILEALTPDVLQLKTSGSADLISASTRVARWTATGFHVGFTGSPSSIFHVATTGNANSIRVSDTTGNVGIGQASDASYPLAVNGSVKLPTNFGLFWSTNNYVTVGATMVLSGGGTTSATRVYLDSGGRIGIGQVATAKLGVYQENTAAAQPVLRLSQSDTDEPFIDFVGTSAADATASLSSATLSVDAKFGAVRVKANGTTKWVRLYDGPA